MERWRDGDGELDLEIMVVLTLMMWKTHDNGR
jgi:hypothetical protein